MLHVACKLVFPDRDEITGEIRAYSPGLTYPILYTGASDRLPMKYTHGTVADLELCFRASAQRTGGTLAVEQNGDYEPRTSLVGHVKS
jgi:hypothetical protein